LNINQIAEFVDVAKGMEPGPDWDEAAQRGLDFEVDQRISW
jgi:hypothetical protein